MSFKKYGFKFLKGLTAYRATSEVNSQVIDKYLESLDCPRALTVALLFRHKEHEQLAKLSYDCLHYLTVEQARDSYAATEVLSKYEDLILSYDKDEVAFTKFDSFETLCRSTNSRFRRLSSDPLFQGRAVRLHHAVVRKIESILGEFDADDFLSMPDWGPGASTKISRRKASPANKFQNETGITRDLHSLFPIETLNRIYPLWAQQLLESGFPDFQVGNKVITVPKNAQTNRVIAVEPGINLWFQMSIGKMIGIKLRRCGIDLRFQSRNQLLAKKGSKDNLIATVDLSSASDSIATEVVRELLPPRWFEVMDICRSHYGMRNSEPVKWEKFSNMGNGFTFQLESLIFYAIAFVCTEYLHEDHSSVSVYGDDIILPSACFSILSEMLAFYGFRTNEKKSFYNSPFRESCGAHYISGVDVKPLYLKSRLSDVLSVYRLANAIRRQAHRRCVEFACDAQLRPAFDYLVQKTPRSIRLRIPETLGDGGFISNFDEATPVRADRVRSHGLYCTGNEGYQVYHATEVAESYQFEERGYLLAALWRMPTQGLDESPLQLDRIGTLSSLEGRAILETIPDIGVFDEIEGRNSVPLKSEKKVRISESIVQQWYDLGPWI